MMEPQIGHLLNHKSIVQFPVSNTISIMSKNIFLYLNAMFLFLGTTNCKPCKYLSYVGTELGTRSTTVKRSTKAPTMPSKLVSFFNSF